MSATVTNKLEPKVYGHPFDYNNEDTTTLVKVNDILIALDEVLESDIDMSEKAFLLRKHLEQFKS